MYDGNYFLAKKNLNEMQQCKGLENKSIFLVSGWCYNATCVQNNVKTRELYSFQPLVYKLAISDSKFLISTCWDQFILWQSQICKDSVINSSLNQVIIN